MDDLKRMQTKEELMDRLAELRRLRKRMDEKYQNDSKRLVAQLEAEKRSEDYEPLTRVELDAEVKKWLEKLDTKNKKVADQFDYACKNSLTTILNEQERDLLRAFKARLYDRHQELATLRALKDNKAHSWIIRHRNLEADFDYARETTQALKRNNGILMAQHRELKQKAKGVSFDRLNQITQLVELKHKRQSLKEDINNTRKSTALSQQPLKEEMHSNTVDQKQSKEMSSALALNQHLEKCIQTERFKLQQVRGEHTTDVRISNQLRSILHVFVSGVKQRIEKEARARPSTAHSKKLSSLTTTRSMHDLKIQLKVVQKLITLTFPQTENTTNDTKKATTIKRPATALPSSAKRPITALLSTTSTVSTKLIRPSTSHPKSQTARSYASALEHDAQPVIPNKFSSLRRGADGSSVPTQPRAYSSFRNTSTRIRPATAHPINSSYIAKKNNYRPITAAAQNRRNTHSRANIGATPSNADPSSSLQNSRQRDVYRPPSQKKLSRQRPMTTR